MYACILATRMAEINGLSSYVRALSAKDSERYLEKLILTNGVRLLDPCAINEWTNDVNK